MRLLRTDTPNDRLEFYTPEDSQMPRYVILSHTWVKDQEVSFQDVQCDDLSIRRRSGYQKILRCCRQAKEAGYDYVWIDTCCIDKTSSAELSEAINSMYKWYGSAEICFVYLEDVLSPSLEDAQKQESEFRRCKWFTRGWTLQELIAPNYLEFYTASWERIGDKDALAETIQSITGVHHELLRGTHIESISIATKMSWGANRETTRIEDRAYSLLGIFGVNMPTIYGEGERAFIRLQHEIMASSPGHSLLAWNISNRLILRPAGVLADSPDRFSRSVGIVDIPPHVFSRVWSLQDGVADPHRTPRGIQLTLPIFKTPEIKDVHRNNRVDVIAVIGCTLVDSAHALRYPIGLALRRADAGASNAYVRAFPNCFVRVQCLLDMGIPWTAEQLILVDDPNKLFSRNAQSVVEPTEAEITIEFRTLHTLRDRSGFGRPIKFSAQRPHQIVWQMDHFTASQLFEGCRDLTYDETKGITIKWDGKSAGRLLFLEQATQPPNSGEQSRILQVLTFPSSQARMYLDVSCLHMESAIDHISVESTLSLTSDDYEDQYERLRCKCGLIADVTLAPLASFSLMEIPRFILDVEVRDVPTQSGASHTQPDSASPLQQEPSELKSHRSLKWVRRLIPSHAEEQHTLAQEQTLKWVECTAGFLPLDPIQWAYNGKGPTYIARMPRQFIGSGFDSSLDSKFSSGCCIVATINTYSPTCASSSYIQEYGYVSSLGYEILVGPADLVFWVRCEGKFKVEALSGATPIDAGHDVDGSQLYFSRYQINQSPVWTVGTIVRVGSLPLSRGSSYEYEVLCTRVEKTSSWDVLSDSSSETHSSTIVLWQT